MTPALVRCETLSARLAETTCARRHLMSKRDRELQARAYLPDSGARGLCLAPCATCLVGAERAERLGGS